MTISANTARDLGARLAVLAIWGKAGWGGKYPAISMLVNIPATILAALYVFLLFSDSLSSIFFCEGCLYGRTYARFFSFDLVSTK